MRSLGELVDVLSMAHRTPPESKGYYDSVNTLSKEETEKSYLCVLMTCRPPEAPSCQRDLRTI